MSVAFQLPSSKNLSGQSGTYGYIHGVYAKLNEMQAIKQIEAKTFGNNGAAKVYKALDLSNLGVKNNPLKKFHQVTMYFPSVNLGANQGKVITHSNNYIVSSNLPDNITYKVGGQWNKPLDWTADATVDLIVRTASDEKTSLKTMASTGLIWTTTEPLELSFTIHAFDDTSNNSKTNIQECLRILGTFALPDEGECVYQNVPAGVDLGISLKTKKWGDLNIGKQRNTDTSKTKKDAVAARAKNFNILIGGMLFLEHVSLKGFTVTYNNTKNMLLHHWNASQVGYGAVGQRLLPMTADITITLTTVRGLSRINYNKMLMLPTNDDSNLLADGYRIDAGQIFGQTADEEVAGKIDISGII